MLDAAWHHRDHLALLIDREHDAARGADGVVDRHPLGPGLQGLSETALLVLASNRWASGAPGVAAVLEGPLGRTASFVADLANDGRWRTQLRRQPGTAALPLGSVTLALRAMGMTADPLTTAVHEAVFDGQLERLETTPTGATGIAWLRHALAPDDQPAPRVVPGSLVSSRAHPVWLSRSDLYDFTHTLFYVTDFGWRSASGDTFSSPAEATGVAAVVDDAIAAQIVDEDYDLLAELVLNAGSLAAPWSAAARVGWSVLMGVWQQCGALPRASFTPTLHRALGDDDARQYWWRHHYHPLFVTAMLVAATEARQWCQPTVETPPHAETRIELDLDPRRHLGPSRFDGRAEAARLAAIGHAGVPSSVVRDLLEAGAITSAARHDRIDELRALVDGASSSRPAATEGRRALDRADWFAQLDAR